MHLNSSTTNSPTSESVNELLIEESGSVLTITFNRPQARNALTFAMYQGLADAIDSLDNRPDIRVVVIQGAGGLAFAAGTDINQFKAFGSAQDAITYENSISKILNLLASCRVPTIAAVSGACTGGGFGIAASCDIRIATRDAKFGAPIARTLGNCLSLATHARIANLIGAARLKDLIITARLMSAQEMQWAGFVSEIVDDFSALNQRVLELSTTIANHAPISMRVTKQSLLALEPSIDSALEEALFLQAYQSEDFKEGIAAFLEKRRPNWQGK